MEIKLEEKDVHDSIQQFGVWDQKIQTLLKEIFNLSQYQRIQINQEKQITKWMKQ